MRFSEDRLASFDCEPCVQRRVHVWEPAAPSAVILAIHGGMAHGGDYVTPALYFRRHGIATAAYDLCGHQDARRVDIPGFEVFLDDSARFLAWVKQNYPDLPIYVMGHSMGALIATHLGLGRFAGDAGIKGFILSSPYYVNAIKVSPLLLALAGVLGALAPRMKVPLAPLTDLLTHDGAITARHHADERDGIRLRGHRASGGGGRPAVAVLDDLRDHGDFVEDAVFARDLAIAEFEMRYPHDVDRRAVHRAVDRRAAVSAAQ
jgi:alpha-beta hydrolase superfamily lysophospholipase